MVKLVKSMKPSIQRMTWMISHSKKYHEFSLEGCAGPDLHFCANSGSASPGCVGNWLNYIFFCLFASILINIYIFRMIIDIKIAAVYYNQKLIIKKILVKNLKKL